MSKAGGPPEKQCEGSVQPLLEPAELDQLRAWAHRCQKRVGKACPSL